jgi:hypothetical protein
LSVSQRVGTQASPGLSRPNTGVPEILQDLFFLAGAEPGTGEERISADLVGRLSTTD